MLAMASLVSACAKTPTLAIAPTPKSEVERAITYRTVDGVDLKLDAYLPPTGAPAPVVVLIHGGAFSEGSRDSGGIQQLASTLVSWGIATFAVSYRLAPEYTFPAPVEDVQAAVEWLKQPEQEARFDIDSRRLALLGNSAGGGIALSVAGRPQAESGIAAVVSLSGPTDYVPEAGETTSGSDQIAAALAYLGCSSPTDCAAAEPASPALNVAAGASPTFLVNGTEEIIPKDQAERMYAALQAQGVPSQLLLIDGSGHGVQLLSPDVSTELKAFLSTYLVIAQ